MGLFSKKPVAKDIEVQTQEILRYVHKYIEVYHLKWSVVSNIYHEQKRGRDIQYLKRNYQKQLIRFCEKEKTLLQVATKDMDKIKKELHQLKNDASHVRLKPHFMELLDSLINIIDTFEVMMITLKNKVQKEEQTSYNFAHIIEIEISALQTEEAMYEKIIHLFGHDLLQSKLNEVRSSLDKLQQLEHAIKIGATTTIVSLAYFFFQEEPHGPTPAELTAKVALLRTIFAFGLGTLAFSMKFIADFATGINQLKHDEHTLE